MTYSHKIPFSELEENIDGWPLIKHAAIENYFVFSGDTTASRRKTPIFTDAYPDYGRLSGK